MKQPILHKSKLSKCALKMTLTIFLMTITVFGVEAKAISQNRKISLDYDQIKIGVLFTKIEQIADVSFLYNNEDIDLEKEVSVHAENKPLEEILSKVLKGFDLIFEVDGDQIVLSPVVQQKVQKIKGNKQSVQRKQQKRTIKGKVTDEDDIPLPGVNVSVKGTNRGTSTDFDGDYSLRGDAEDVLVFSCLGYQTKKKSLSNVKDEDNKVNVILVPKKDELDEVVLVGYGSQKKEDITGAVSSVNVEELNKSNPTTFDKALVGKVAGVHVTPASGAPGSSASIRIRGVTSVFGNNEPLYVIDDIPVEIGKGQGNSFYSEESSNTISPLASINPQDIESIDILKDASATSIYGSRGANGVVIINTKKGSYSSVPGITFSTRGSVSNFMNEYNVLNSKQFYDIIKSGYQNSDQDLPENNLLYPYGKNVNTDWQGETGQTAVSTNYYLGINGGLENGRTLYSISAGITDQKGAIKNTRFKRNNIRTKLETKLSDKLRVGTNISYSDEEKRGTNNTFYYQTIQYRPDIPILDKQGNYGVSTDSVQANPYTKIGYPSNIKSHKLLLSLFGEYQIINGLLFKSRYSYNKSTDKNFNYTPSYDVFEIRNNRKGTLKQVDSKFTSRIFDNTLTYKHNFNKHNIDAVAGISYTEDNTDNTLIKAIDFPDDEIMVTPGAASDQNIESSGTISGLSSYFFRLNYNFNDTYYLTLSGRADKSTKFGPKNRWGFFPSGALAWRISNEDFLNDIEFINNLKLRASYGRTGSANFSDFQYATFFSAGSFYHNHNGVVSNTIPNPNIKWETTDQLDIGLDFVLFDKRISGTIEYFNKKTSDQILKRDVILETGGTSQFDNIGDFLNRGFEFQLGADIFTGNTFQWTTDLNISTIKSKVLSLNGGYYKNLQEGESISHFSGYKVAGIFQNKKEIKALNEASPTGVYQAENTAPGDFKYVDVNKDGFIGDDDITVIGEAEPDFFGGWNNIFRFGNLEVSTLFNFSVGNYLYNSNKRDLLIFDNYGNNYANGILGAWTSERTDTNIPRLVAGDPNNNRRDSDFFIEDASFFKLKNINITYNFNSELLDNLPINRASISLSLSNVFVLTSYSGLDPEVNYSAANNFNQGYDSAAYPSVRTFTLGINLDI